MRQSTKRIPIYGYYSSLAFHFYFYFYFYFYLYFNFYLHLSSKCFC